MLTIMQMCTYVFLLHVVYYVRESSIRKDARTGIHRKRIPKTKRNTGAMPIADTAHCCTIVLAFLTYTHYEYDSKDQTIDSTRDASKTGRFSVRMKTEIEIESRLALASKITKKIQDRDLKKSTAVFRTTSITACCLSRATTPLDKS